MFLLLIPSGISASPRYAVVPFEETLTLTNGYNSCDIHVYGEYQRGNQYQAIAIISFDHFTISCDSYVIKSYGVSGNQIIVSAEGYAGSDKVTFNGGILPW